MQDINEKIKAHPDSVAALVSEALRMQREACAAAYESTIADPDNNPSYMATKILILNALIDGDTDGKEIR